MLEDQIPKLGIVACLLFCLPAIVSLLGIEVDEKACRKMCNMHPVGAIVWITFMFYAIKICVQSLRAKKNKNKKIRK